MAIVAGGDMVGLLERVDEAFDEIAFLVFAS